MTNEQLSGLAILVLGAYFVICSVLAQGFVLYRVKAGALARLWGEAMAHKVLFGVGLLALVAGVVLLFGLWR